MSDLSQMALKQLQNLLANDPLLKDVMAGSLPTARRSGPWRPDVDVLEFADRFVVIVDLPGVSRDAIEVELLGNQLVLRGRRAVHRPEGAQLTADERPSGAFERRFKLPIDAAGEQVTAKLDEGVLTVTVPRLEQAQGVKVDIA